ncbi:imidazoleglycerol-phosphate dehydratase [Thermococcus sp. EP1]|uniref:imidazoleglycerol-phosphate dehydratase HisB n=1 Tax=Thermococcus sp. EP1 TaxID=1591054 RepID=UPI0006D96922|nr:imidazoleglycerol-phosphate dehydratase HisB [Thermococcus sp. EP1]KPU63010.1 imidazoleglycerol-phosphate dehydratase [Thermococcus sp. EP1]
MRRKTRETDITVELGSGGGIKTGDKVFDHLLTALFFYMREEVSVSAEWDLRHHLWEDLGIVLGEELREKIKGKKIARFGNAIIPMDDALVLVAVDISRPYLNLELDFKESEEGFEFTLVREFLWALARTLNATIHVKQLSGVNAHHIVEATFKGLGVALRQALSESERLESTKGVL